MICSCSSEFMGFESANISFVPETGILWMIWMFCWCKLSIEPKSIDKYYSSCSNHWTADAVLMFKLPPFVPILFFMSYPGTKTAL